MIKKINRREFARCAALAPAGAAIATALGSSLGIRAAIAQTPIERVGGPRLKASLNAYSFSAALNNPEKGPGKGMTLFDLLDYCAVQNFDGLDPTGYFFPGYPKPPSDKYIADFKRRAFQLGVAITGTGVRNNFAQQDKTARAADVELVKQWIEVAAKMGAPVIRVFAGQQPAGPAWNEIAGWVVDEVQKCVEYGKQFGVMVGIQNHGDLLKTGEQVVQILKAVDSPWFGSIVDTGSFASADPYQDIALVTPFAVNFQLKEKLDGKDGKTKTDLKKVIQIVRAANYRGYLPIETLAPSGQPYDPKARVAEFLKEVRAAIDAAS